MSKYVDPATLTPRELLERSLNEQSAAKLVLDQELRILNTEVIRKRTLLGELSDTIHAEEQRVVAVTQRCAQSIKDCEAKTAERIAELERTASEVRARCTAEEQAAQKRAEASSQRATDLFAQETERRKSLESVQAMLTAATLAAQALRKAVDAIPA